MLNPTTKLRWLLGAIAVSATACGRSGPFTFGETNVLTEGLERETP